MFRRGGIAADCIYCIIKTNPAVGHNTITGSRRLDDVVVACRCQGHRRPSTSAAISAATANLAEHNRTQ